MSYMCRDFLFSHCHRKYCVYKHKLLQCVFFGVNGFCYYEEKCKYLHVPNNCMKDWEERNDVSPALAYERRRIYDQTQRDKNPWCDLRSQCYRPGCEMSHNFSDDPAPLSCKKCKFRFANDDIIFLKCGHLFCTTCLPLEKPIVCTICGEKSVSRIVKFEEVPEGVELYPCPIDWRLLHCRKRQK